MPIESPKLTIDVAHPPRRAEVVEDELQQAASQARNSPGIRVLKIIHGHGSSGKGGATRETVRNWLYLNRRMFRDVIDGENYDPGNMPTATLRKEVGTYADSDLNACNEGVTIVWIK